MQTFEIAILWLLSVIVALFVGSFLKSYFSKKGENLATHEDINKLVDQVKAVTQTTKEIESKISGELWDKQKRWELKRDVLCDVIKKASSALDVFSKLEAAYKLNRQDNQIVGDQHLYQPTQQWLAAINELTGSVAVVGVVCSVAVHKELSKFCALLQNSAGKIVVGETYDTNALAKNFVFITMALRKEIGID